MNIINYLLLSALDDESVRGMPVMGRITGSASIETLVRVGIEKENGFAPDSKMVVMHNFNPCVDDELEVKKGQIVNVLYSENDWVYVVSEDNKEGFIPKSYCATYGSQQANLILNIKKKMPRDTSLLLGGGGVPGQGPGAPQHQPDQYDTGHNNTAATIPSSTTGKSEWFPVYFRDFTQYFERDKYDDLIRKASLNGDRCNRGLIL